MNLGSIITALEAADPQQPVPHGFANPHSYRGDYMDLAFEPTPDTTVSAMLTAARSALGATFQGWKGGDFLMDADTWCWLSPQGDASCETLSPEALAWMLRPAATVPASAPTDQARWQRYADVEQVGLRTAFNNQLDLFANEYDRHREEERRLRDAAEAHRLTLSQALGLGPGAPWDAIRDRAAELAAPADRAAILREVADALPEADLPFVPPMDRRRVANWLRRLADAASGPGPADGETRSYAERVNAPLSESTITALNQRLRAGDTPVHTVRRRADGETQQDEPESLPLLFWDEPAGIVYEDGRITAWLSKAVSLAHSVPAGQLILQPDVAARLRRALTTVLGAADDAREAAERAAANCRDAEGCHRVVPCDPGCAARWPSAAVSQPGNEA